jgi:hypothetical protein
MNRDESSKPYDVVWFSQGSWIYNSYHDNSCHTDHDTIDESSVLLIQNPKNILEIRTIEDLQKFRDTYHQTKTTAATIHKNEFIRNNSNFVKNIIDDYKDCPKKLEEVVYFGSISQFSIQFELNSEKIIEMLRTFAEKQVSEILSDGSLRHETIEDAMREKFPHCEGLSKSIFDKKFANINYLISLRNVVNMMCTELIVQIPDKLEPDFGKIDWDKIRDAGYWGISFHFCKVGYIGASWIDYWWHNGFDVESLCIWDLRAFDNIVYPLILKV